MHEIRHLDEPILKNPVFFLSAGEASGDLHGSNLMKSLKALCPEATFVGIGGALMKAEGLKCIVPAEQLCVVGLVEILKQVPMFLRTLRQVSQAMIREKADIFIPIDFPDYNLRLCKAAKRHSIPVAYYICPQVWAWRSGRIKQIEKLVDLLLCIFPFEPRHFSKVRLKTRYVGHPLLDEIKEGKSKDSPPRGKGRLAIMPGSRHSEIKQHLPVLLEFLPEFSQKWPELSFHIPCAHTLKIEDLSKPLQEGLPPEVFEKITIHPQGQSSQLLNDCDAALIASGTSTLQGAIIDVPLALFYHLNPLTYYIGKKLVNLPYIGLVNLVAEKSVCRELIQNELDKKSLCKESELLLWDSSYREKMLHAFAMVREKLGGPGASDRAAESILRLVEKHR